MGFGAVLVNLPMVHTEAIETLFLAIRNKRNVHFLFLRSKYTKFHPPGPRAGGHFCSLMYSPTRF